MQRIIGKKKQVHFTAEQIERIRKIRERHGISESEAIRTLLDLGLDVYDNFEYVGVPQIAELISKVKKKIREGRQPKLV